VKAFVVKKYGPDGLGQADVPAPAPGRHEVLVDIRAASINPLDKMVRNGEFKQLLKYKPPFAPQPRPLRRRHPGRIGGP
jgi:NADPH:quinone reductase-like Zn-dependent oxidoreductase